MTGEEKRRKVKRIEQNTQYMERDFHDTMKERLFSMIPQHVSRIRS